MRETINGLKVSDLTRNTLQSITQEGPSTLVCTKTWTPLDPPYLIDLIDLIGSACPLWAIVPITFGKSPNISEKTPS